MKIRLGVKGFRFVKINLVPAFFTKYLPGSTDRFYQFLKNIHNGKNAHINHHNYPVTPQMYFIIQEMMQCNPQGMFKRMFLEVKVLELLMLQLEQMSTSENKVYAVSKAIREKIYAVQEIITTNLKRV